MKQPEGSGGRGGVHYEFGVISRSELGRNTLMLLHEGVRAPISQSPRWCSPLPTLNKCMCLPTNVFSLWSTGTTDPRMDMQELYFREFGRDIRGPKRNIYFYIWDHLTFCLASPAGDIVHKVPESLLYSRGVCWILFYCERFASRSSVQANCYAPLFSFIVR